MAITVSIPDAQPSAGRSDRLRFRASRSQALFIALPFCLIVVAQAAVYFLVPARRGDHGADWLYLAAATLFVTAMFLQARFGATLTLDGVLVHGFRRRTIAWQHITCIRAEKFSGNRVISIYEFGSQRTRLRYPSSGALFEDRNFDEKLKVIQDWWAYSRASLPRGP